MQTVVSCYNPIDLNESTVYCDFLVSDQPGSGAMGVRLFFRHFGVSHAAEIQRLPPSEYK